MEVIANVNCYDDRANQSLDDSINVTWEEELC